MKSSVGWVFEDNSSETFVINHSTVADELNLGHARDGLEDRMKDRVFCRLSLVISMPIGLGLWIESLKGAVVR